ncbi:junction-mediating and -regulatory protein-like [Pantherophis guttatus]|uniref:Junction-mediating and -regulatory protein-like n=1 Tax=Pantherophis guttatus TaxID=94885 RepID=A0ABM3ZCL7_PANGU|nr:junction-mediating and -regulatory protein-like [Pantherophis guttatus]
MPPPLLPPPPPPPPPCGLSTHPFTTKKGSSMDMTPGVRRRAGLLPSWSPHAVPSASQPGPPVRFRGLLQPSARPLSPYGLEQQQQRRLSAPLALLPTQRVSAPLAGGAPVHVRREERHSPLEQKDVHLAPRDEID